tara:strand:+ start:264 stop:623 length:360 start_codon:yes stop_codon:yes gene_type:complete
MNKLLHGHTSPETAYIVEDYPWGFRLRTQQRHWIESKESHGMRFVTQTMDPKNQRWCKPKCSTYAKYVYMYLDDNNHVVCNALHQYTSIDSIKKFVEEFKEQLNEKQSHMFRKFINGTI